MSVVLKFDYNRARADEISRMAVSSQNRVSPQNRPSENRASENEASRQKNCAFQRQRDHRRDLQLAKLYISSAAVLLQDGDEDEQRVSWLLEECGEMLRK